MDGRSYNVTSKINLGAFRFALQPGKRGLNVSINNWVLNFCIAIDHFKCWAFRFELVCAGPKQLHDSATIFSSTKTDCNWCFQTTNKIGNLADTLIVINLVH